QSGRRDVRLLWGLQVVGVYARRIEQRVEESLRLSLSFIGQLDGLCPRDRVAYLPDKRGASGEKESPLGLGDRAAEGPRGLDPLADHRLRLGKRLAIGRAISHTAGELRHLREKGMVLLAPVED